MAPKISTKAPCLDLGRCELDYTDSPEFKAQDSAAMKKAFLAFSRAGMEAYPVTQV